MNYRNRKLLDLAHTAPCFAKFDHQCMEHLGCDPAHSDSHIFGKGKGLKAHDWAFASLCNPAHMMLGQMEREERFYEWLHAFVATQKYLWEEGLVKC